MTYLAPPNILFNGDRYSFAFLFPVSLNKRETRDDVDKRFFRILVEVYILVSRKCKSATKVLRSSNPTEILRRNSTRKM